MTNITGAAAATTLSFTTNSVTQSRTISHLFLNDDADSGEAATSGPRFADNSDGSVQLRFHRGTIIPEPEEYALVLGLFTLGFVFFLRHRC